MIQRWFKSSEIRGGPALGLIRVAVAIILVIHPTYDLLHWADVSVVDTELETVGAAGGGWGALVVVLIQVAASGCLLVRRLMKPAVLIHLALLLAGVVLVHAPFWYAVGGGAEEGHPGAELSALLMVCLAGIGWPRLGLPFIRVGAALILMAHPIHGLLDPEGLHEFGEAMGRRGFPFGVVLVWLAMFTQVGSSLALVAGRFVVFGCVGHLGILGLGLFVSHYPRWFVIGPGESGMEYSLVFISCFAAMLYAYWPAPSQRAVT